MRCPFAPRPRWRQVAPCADDLWIPPFYIWELVPPTREERAFNAAHPTCWHKFLHCLGLR